MRNEKMQYVVIEADSTTRGVLLTWNTLIKFWSSNQPVMLTCFACLFEMLIVYNQLVVSYVNQHSVYNCEYSLWSLSWVHFNFSTAAATAASASATTTTLKQHIRIVVVTYVLHNSKWNYKLNKLYFKTIFCFESRWTRILVAHSHT